MAEPNKDIPVTEVFWALVEKADKKFSKIRDLPYHERSRYEYFFKVFKVYTQLWKFQQENRQKLVESGLKRWEIGEIASRIAQLYYGQYMRTSDASYLTESYVFYDAILTREYFKEGLLQDLNLANKQLRFLARFLMVCLVLNRRDVVHQLVNQLKVLVDECRRTYQVKFSELTLDTFRMLQCLEWEPSGAFYKTHNPKLGQNGVPGPSRVNYAQDISDPTLPPNPRKVVLYRPSMTHLLAVLGTLCEELNPDGVLLIYLSASGRIGNTISSTTESRASINSVGSLGKSLQSHGIDSDAASVSSSDCLNNNASPTSRRSKKDCLNFGTHTNGGQNNVYPSDLIPFTRRPLFIIVDSDGSDAFKAINGGEKGEPAAVFLSPSSSILSTSTDTSRRESGSLFTIFLTAPLQGFCLLLGLSGPDIEMDTFNRAEKLLSSSLNDWGASLVMSEPLDPVWAQVLGDPFLRRLVLRFLFCRAALTLYGTSFGKKELHPECLPSLPPAFLPTAVQPQTLILQLANVFGASKKFLCYWGLWGRVASCVYTSSDNSRMSGDVFDGQREQRVTFLYLANDILQNSKRKGSEFVNEFWKVLPKELKVVYESGDEHAKKVVARLVNIWEERKVFGSRAQNLKDEMLGKVPLPPVVSNGKSSNQISNPIKIVKRDASSLRIKLMVGCTPEKILTAFQSVLDENQTEEAALDKSSTTVSHLGKIREDVESTLIAGNQPGSALMDELQMQENVLQQCAGQLETAENLHSTLISQLKEALKEQESKFDIVHSQLQVVRGHIEQSSNLRKRLATVFVPGPSATTTTSASDGTRGVELISSSPGRPTTTTSTPPPPQPTPVSQSAAAVSFAAPLQPPAADEESKKSAAAAVAAKLSASSSSAQMLTSVLSSLVAEELNGTFKSAGFADVFPPEKRPRLEQRTSETDSNNNMAAFFSSVASTNQIQAASFGSLQPPFPPPPPPMSQTSTPANQYMQQPGGMMAASMMPPYGYGASGNFPPPPTMPPPNFELSSLAGQPTSLQQLQPLEPPQQQQQQQQQQQTPATSGGYYRPPGIGGFYGQIHQATTPPVPRHYGVLKLTPFRSMKSVVLPLVTAPSMAPIVSIELNMEY
ncbi:unnamed protein product [Linum tenue]|uniref:CID domain-containing protein n=1 Tax=Linum tenue TaxID=586396 RepID=A0AAV0HL04_9ROSI|nr:unnamed protein product [Linum tenue]